jgi:K+-sensing histidine kinase KdpD
MEPEEQVVINSCYQSTENIVLMVSNILDFSKLRNGSLKLNYTPSDPLRLIKKMVDLLASQITEKVQI